MNYKNDDNPVCPLCEQQFSRYVTVKMGDSWADSFGKPPHSLLSEYMMVHSAQTRDGLKVFLHTETDLK